MRKILKMRWPLLVIWIISLSLSLIYSPDLNKVLRSKGQQFLSNDNPSVKADNILKKIDKTGGNTNIIVFSSNSKLNSSDMDNIKSGINNIKSNKSPLE